MLTYLAKCNARKTFSSTTLGTESVVSQWISAFQQRDTKFDHHTEKSSKVKERFQVACYLNSLYCLCICCWHRVDWATSSLCSWPLYHCVWRKFWHLKATCTEMHWKVSSRHKVLSICSTKTHILYLYSSNKVTQGKNPDSPDISVDVKHNDVQPSPSSL